MNNQPVHIRNTAGRPIFNRLWNTPGENVMLFDTPGGFVTKDEVKRRGWKICPGWVRAEDFGTGRQI